jgi:ABC-type transporter Mla maintaining outer membrane lipid asymmetry ATPase subunit MlaF
MSKLNRFSTAVGLLQTINQVPSELSGGQRKRIGIARTLILKPEIMLYDEPTAGLDPITCLEINELINDVKEKYHTSSIIITHDLTCARATGDRIAMLLDGKFLKQGTFEEVFDIGRSRESKVFTIIILFSNGNISKETLHHSRSLCRDRHYHLRGRHTNNR